MCELWNMWTRRSYHALTKKCNEIIGQEQKGRLPNGEGDRLAQVQFIGFRFGRNLGHPIEFRIWIFFSGASPFLGHREEVRPARNNNGRRDSTTRFIGVEASEDPFSALSVYLLLLLGLLLMLLLLLMLTLSALTVGFSAQRQGATGKVASTCGGPLARIEKNIWAERRPGSRFRFFLRFIHLFLPIYRGFSLVHSMRVMSRPEKKTLVSSGSFILTGLKNAAFY